METIKRIGIMGGTFNPIHNGHITLAKKAYTQYDLDKVLFMPAKEPPHKDKNAVEEAEHRINMVKLALEGMDYFEYSDFEINREGKSYTYKTLELLTKENPDTEYFFIMGADSLFQFETWKHPELVVKYATILVAGRNDISKTSFVNQIEYLNDKFNCEIMSIDMEEVPVSSTDLRLMIANGCNVSKYLNNSVFEYIVANTLYEDMQCKIKSFEDTDILKKDLKKKLDAHRYEHTISVAHMCAALAMKYEVNVFDAFLAGLFHDLAKCTPDEEMLAICKSNCIKTSEIERNNPYLLHGKVGAFLAKKQYNLMNEDILNSIIYHTTGRAGMSMLEKIVFIADYIEPLRDKVPNLTYIRKLAFEDIDKAICMALSNTLTYLTKKGCPIDNTTMEAYEYYN